mmetsp:Transcript_33555/g.87037  ORF Transcript_33555/g.87037 Transcript_33555/m.87037 type:complete len:227 (-) Transcript_33555:47-727(-)
MSGSLSACAQRGQPRLRRQLLLQVALGVVCVRGVEDVEGGQGCQGGSHVRQKEEAIHLRPQQTGDDREAASEGPRPWPQLPVAIVAQTRDTEHPQVRKVHTRRRLARARREMGAGRTRQRLTARRASPSSPPALAPHTARAPARGCPAAGCPPRAAAPRRLAARASAACAAASPPSGRPSAPSAPPQRQTPRPPPPAPSAPSSPPARLASHPQPAGWHLGRRQCSW